MKETLKAIGSVVVWIAVMVGVALVAMLLIRGGVWLSDKIYPWLILLSELALAVSVLALAPLAAFRETRGHAGLGFFIVSYVFGTTLWVWSLLLTYVLWGGAALLIGLFLGGVGVLPIALLATAFKGMWSMFGQLILVLVATYATRAFGFNLIQKAERENEDTYVLDEPLLPLKLIVSSWFLLPGLFVPFIGYFFIIPLIVCPIILCCSKARRARRHGQILLAGLVLIFVAATLIGWFFPGWFPARA